MMQSQRNTNINGFDYSSFASGLNQPDPHICVFKLTTMKPEISKEAHQIFSDRHARGIFNDTMEARPDSKRLQRRVIAWRYPLCEDLLSQLSSALMRAVPTHHPTAFYLIGSKSGCPEQHLHTDVSKTYIQEISDSEKPFPFQVLVFVDTAGGALTVKLASGLQTVNFEFGDIVVFHGGMVHAGAAYATENVRLHFYMDVKGISREENTIEGVVLNE